MTSSRRRATRSISRKNHKSVATRERYGMTRFGQCLSAGATTHRSWTCDLSRSTRSSRCLTRSPGISTAAKPFTSIDGMKNIVAPMYDQAYGALDFTISSDRGMLESTLVCNLAEFGRTPRSQSRRRARSLAAVLFSTYFAGGGVQGGTCRWSERPDRWSPGRARRRIPGDIRRDDFP
jgi:hypothetical protein